jgi:K+-sensing histidine kinase KdpD
MFDSIKSDKEGESLRMVLQQKEEIMAQDEARLFTYAKDGSTYKLHVKQVTMCFNKAPCRVLLISNHTPFFELAKLEEKYQAIYLASVVHDIRNPLQGILGILEMISRPDASPEDQLSIQVGKDTCTQLIFLTHDITDLGQLNAKKLKLKKEPFNVRELIDRCIKLNHFQATQKGLRLEYLRSEADRDRDLWANNDKHRYTQVLLNLLSNALKFTIEGAITVSTFYDRPHELLRTEVTDTGLGIKAEDQQKLFQLFGKLDDTASANPQGVGLGLTICQKLCAAMGGTLSLRSEYRRGSTFCFTIKTTGEVASGGGSYLDHCDEFSEGVSDPVPSRSPYKFQHHRRFPSQMAVSPNPPELCADAPEETCVCPQILIVDDNPCIVFVMKGYLRGTNVRCEEVGVTLHLFVGPQWEGCGREGEGQSCGSLRLLL